VEDGCWERSEVHPLFPEGGRTLVIGLAGSRSSLNTVLDQGKSIDRALPFNLSHGL